jgi:type IV pilus assembly protein PilB
MIHFDDQKQNDQIRELKEKEEEDLAEILATRHGIRYVDLTGININTDALKLIPEDEARKARFAVFDLVGKRAKIAVQSPTKEDTQSQIKDLESRGYVCELFMVSIKSLERAWSRYQDISYSNVSKAGTLEVSATELEQITKQVISVAGAEKIIKDTLSLSTSFRISRIVEILIASGVALKASDVHIEPEQEDVTVRVRLDGVLVVVAHIDRETYRMVLSRIKLLSGLKLNIHESSQDGRYSIKMGGKELEIRTSVLPGNNGESIVMRILDPSTIALPITSLGMWPNTLAEVKKQINRPKGMILNTGPTGSGKTTALYAFLNHLKTPEVKIITIEDPVEYHLAGVVQTQVDRKKDYDFASGLRASLRQDPDIIMVGEIRDKETAETAIHAALTGHLVFSTLHTNNAAGAFTRLIDLGINPKILTSAINIAIAQRLVRKLCNECKEKIKLEGSDLELVKKTYDGIVHKEVPFTEEIFKAKEGGCEKCNHTGYKGRIAIMEAVLTDEKVEDVIEKNPSEREIMRVSKDQGIADMVEDGVMKILAGTTSLDEVTRVADMYSREGKDFSGI